MKKRFITLLLAIVYMLLPLTLVSASDEKIFVFDNADVLSDSQEADLAEKAEQISKKYDSDIVICFYNESDYDMKLAESFYERGGYNSDGIILAVGIEEREYEFYGFGKYDRDDIDSYPMQEIEDALISELKNNNYFEAADDFCDNCEKLFSEVRDGKEYEKSFNVGAWIIGALAIGFIIAFFVTNHMKSQLNNVKWQTRAENYVVQNSMNVTESRDLFMYRNIIRTPRPKSNSSSGGSRGGSSRAGRSGRF